jgi:hypothetical protein
VALPRILETLRDAMKSRPRTRFVMKLKNRRCAKCGAKLNNQVKRCRRCTAVASKPRK